MARRTKAQQVGPFILDNDLDYEWTVYAYTPDGKHLNKKVKFKAHFRHLSPQRRKKIMEEYREKSQQIADIESGRIEADEVDAVDELITFEELILREAMSSFSGIKDRAGNDLDCNDETMDMFMANSWARGSAFSAFMTSLQSRSAEGN